MEMIPVPANWHRPYGKGPQRSGGPYGVGRFFMGVPGEVLHVHRLNPP